MERRRFNALLAGGCLGLLSPRDSAAASVRRPNIIVILADDLGYGDLGCYGNVMIRTPRLDRMAGEGMRFEQFYSVSPVCSPSRAALMTGRYPIRSGVTHVLSPLSRHGLPRRETTMAEVLKSSGYATACIGKWHLGRRRELLPTRQGFDYFFGLPYSNDMSPATNPRNPIYRIGVVGPLPLMRQEKVIERGPDLNLLTGRYTGEAIRFIEQSHRRRTPFFLYLPHTSPHPPLHVGARFRGKSPGGLYGDVVEEIDWSTGEILDALGGLGIEEETLIVFSSDNGAWLARGSEGGSSGPLCCGKGSTWEGGLRVPFLARWLGKIPAGVTTRAFGTLMDLLPTCAALSKGRPPEERTIDGRDLSAVLLDNDDGREPLLFCWVGYQLRAVRKGPWKLHVITTTPANGSRAVTKHDPPLLFHIDSDPAEQRDVAADHPDVVRELLALMRQHKREIWRARGGHRFHAG